MLNFSIILSASGGFHPLGFAFRFRLRSSIFGLRSACYDPTRRRDKTTQQVGKAGGLQILRCQGFAVDDYGFAPGAFRSETKIPLPGGFAALRLFQRWGKGMILNLCHPCKWVHSQFVNCYPRLFGFRFQVSGSSASVHHS